MHFLEYVNVKRRNPLEFSDCFSSAGANPGFFGSKSTAGSSLRFSSDSNTSPGNDSLPRITKNDIYRKIRRRNATTAFRRTITNEPTKALPWIPAFAGMTFRGMRSYRPRGAGNARYSKCFIKKSQAPPLIGCRSPFTGQSTDHRPFRLGGSIVIPANAGIQFRSR